MGKSDMMGSFHGNYRYSLLISRSVYNNPFTSIHVLIQNLYLGSYIDSIIYSNNIKAKFEYQKSQSSTSNKDNRGELEIGF